MYSTGHKLAEIIMEVCKDKLEVVRLSSRLKQERETMFPQRGSVFDNRFVLHYCVFLKKRGRERGINWGHKLRNRILPDVKNSLIFVFFCTETKLENPESSY